MITATSTRSTTKVSEIKTPAPELTLEQKVSRYVKVATANELLAAEYQKEQDAIRLKYEKRFTAQKEELESLDKSISAECKTRRDEIFKGLKSITLCGAILSWRAGTPSLTLLDGFTWESALDKAQKLAKDYVVNKPQLDKNRLKSLFTDTDGKKLLKKLGLTVKAEESFSIKVENA